MGVDSKRAQQIIDLVDTITPAWRLEQMLVETCNLINGGKIDRKIHLGHYVRAVVTDIQKEELDVIRSKEFELKDLTKRISEVAKESFLEREKEELTEKF